MPAPLTQVCAHNPSPRLADYPTDCCFVGAEFTLYKWEAACPLCNETAVYGTFARQLPFECDLKPGISSLTPPEVSLHLVSH